MYSPHSPALSSTFGDHRSFVSANHHNGRQHHLHHQNAYQHQHSPNSASGSSGHHHATNGHFIHNSPYSAASFTTTLTSNSTSRHTAPITSGAGHTLANHNHHNHLQQKTSVQCLRFKYFTTFFVCTTCLVLLSASLATHKWLVSKPIRQLHLINGQRTNFTALMLTLDDDHQDGPASARGFLHQAQVHSPAASQEQTQMQTSGQTAATTTTASNKFQGEIYFGLFNGVKVLNHGFGDRVSQLSGELAAREKTSARRALLFLFVPIQMAPAIVLSVRAVLCDTSELTIVVQAYLNGGQKLHEQQHQQQQAHSEPLINFKFWLLTLAGVVLAILFALVGSIFAIINFVMTPRGTMSGPAGLVIWNAAACFSCLLAIFAWLAEYFLRLKTNVLTHEEIQNGWTSENRSQFGYSYYFVVLAFCLHLVNIFIVSIVQSETWTNNASCSKAAKRQTRSACDGVIMLY